MPQENTGISIDPTVNDMPKRKFDTLSQRVERLYNIAESSGGNFVQDGEVQAELSGTKMRLMYALTTTEARTNNEAMVLSLWRRNMALAFISGKLESINVGVSRRRQRISDELEEFLLREFNNA